MNYTGINEFGLLSFTDASGGRADSLQVYGREVDDVVDVGATGLVTSRDPISFFRYALNIDTTGILQLGVLGLGGDDLFAVAALHPFLMGVHVEGGDPSASDVLTFGAAIGTVTVDMGAGFVTELGAAAPVFFTGVEVLNIDAAGQEVQIIGTIGDDVLDVSPTGPNSGTAELTSTQLDIGSRPVVNFANASPSSLVASLSTGDDKLIVRYSSDNDTIDVNEPAATITVPGFIDVEYTGVDSLAVYGNEGNDTFNVTPGTIPIFVDGGDPIGTSPGDTINIVNSGGAMISFEPGPENDEGGFVISGSERVSFDHIETSRADREYAVRADFGHQRRR